MARNIHTAIRQLQLHGATGWQAASGTTRGPARWPQATAISGMGGVVVREATIRIPGAMAKPLTRASLLNERSLLDLTLAIIMLQVSG